MSFQSMYPVVYLKVLSNGAVNTPTTTTTTTPTTMHVPKFTEFLLTVTVL
jgi:hypothetical protein